MAISEYSTNSQACTLDVEHTLDTITAGGTFVLTVDLNVLVAGDVLVVRCYDKVTSGSTSRLIYTAVYEGVQADPIMVTKPFSAPHEAKFSIEQTDGTGRTFDWSIRQLDS